jgi:hypothetical protein
MMNTRLLESIDLVLAAPPADFNSAVTVDWISLKNYEGCLVVWMKAVGTAGDDWSLQLNQATAVAGTSSKALTFSQWYYKSAVSIATTTTFTKVTEATATADLDLGTPTDYAHDINQALYVVDVKASDLDVSNGFDCIAATFDDADNSSTSLGAILYIPYGARYPQATPKAAVSN